MNPKNLREAKKAHGPKRTMPKVRPPQRLRVSDHAVVRYMERVLGIDVSGLRELIWQEAGPAAAAGASKWKVGPVRYAMEGGCITTVVVDEADLPERLVPLVELFHKP